MSHSVIVKIILTFVKMISRAFYNVFANKRDFRNAIAGKQPTIRFPGTSSVD